MLRLAIVHDWLSTHTGAEKVIEAVLEVYPNTPLYTLVYQSENFRNSLIANTSVQTSFIQRFPKGRYKYRSYLPFMPFAVEQFDLGGYDVVVSSNTAVAKGVLTRADQLHISYVNTPVRYAWDLYFQYLQENRLDRGVKGWIAKAILHYLRLWDVVAANRVDVFVANSHNIARRVKKTYRRDAEVIYPPVDVDKFNPTRPRENFYVTVSRLVPYKKIDLIIEAFNKLGLPLVVIGDGPDIDRYRQAAKPNVTLLGYQETSVMKDYLERARAFIFAAEEDFGIAPVEAQAAGCPVIAYGKGGALETVADGVSGIFFRDQTADSLVESVRRFESGVYTFHAAVVRQNAERFSKQRFQAEFSSLVQRSWDEFSQGRL